MTKLRILLVLLALTRLIECQDYDVALNNGASIEKNAHEEALKRPERLTVVAPRQLRPQSDYHVLITLENSTATAQVDLQLTGARDSNKEQSEAKSILISSGETQTVKFTIGDWLSAEYLLNVTAQATDRSWSWTAEEPLEFKVKSYSAFIQTDKAIYKPGQLVQFRTLFLTQNLTPQVLKDEVNVTVTDPARNLIKQWTDLSNYRGLLSLELQLTDDPMFGDWTIAVEARGQQVSKNFQVAEYILPTFEVRIILPPYATYKEADITATIEAFYTFGKPVKGNVALTVQPLVRFSSLSTRPLQQFQHRARLSNGTTEINVDLVKDLKLSPELFEREIEFFALVEEELTGRKYNKTETIKIHDKKVAIELVNEMDKFKPGLSHTVQLKVAYHDNTPVEDNGPNVELIATSLGRVFESAKLQPLGGYIQHTFDVPRTVNLGSEYPSNEQALSPNEIQLKAIYQGQTHYLSSVYPVISNSNQHLKISLPQLEVNLQGRSNQAKKRKPFWPKIHVDEELQVRVQATEPLQQFTCQGIARGDIIWALSPNAKSETSYNFTVKVDQRMVPEAMIMCFYVRAENKELIADSVRAAVSWPRNRNIVKLTASKEEAKPGQEVEVNVQTKPNSLVGVLAIDQSVLLLKSGNDITAADVAKDIKLYGSGERSKSTFAESTSDLVRDAGMILMTNNRLSGRDFMSGRLYFRNKGGPLSGIVLYSAALHESLQPPDFHLSKRSVEPLVIRSNFPETWLWENATAGSDGNVRLKTKVPDTITSWVMSAFSMNENEGLALTWPATTLKVFRPFFVKINLPYSIIRGETVNIQVVVFNYMKRPTAVRLTMENKNGDFEFVEAANNIEDEKLSNDQTETKLFKVPPGEGGRVSFLIRPKRLGPIDIRVIAQGEFASDGVVRKLLVKPEGQAQNLNKAMLINLEGPQSTWSRNVSIDVPANAVPDSSKVYVTAVGDIMGPGLSNVDDLLRLPYGCGEQNMINLVPNIVILNYLQRTNRLKEVQRARAIRNIETGYQRQLNYKRLDGSFSAFGNDDNNGSVWLTAYVLKTMQQAKSAISTVDERVVRRAANYLARFSRSDGSIEESGMLHNKDLQSQAASGASTYLTAYAMIALLQRKIAPDGEAPAPVALDEVVQRGLEFLESKLDEVATKDSPYELAIITYALHLANRKPEVMDKAYEKLWSRAQEKDGSAWWQAESSALESSAKLLASSDSSESENFDFDSSSSSTTSTVQPPLKPVKKNTRHSAHLFIPDSLNVEMTSLALMTAVKRGDIDKAYSIVRWLVQKQNSNGGFASTQDTVLAIEALASFAESSLDPKAPLSIDLEFLYPRVTNKTSQPTTTFRRTNVDQMLISRQNALVNQQIRLPDNTTWVQVKATGAGSAVVHVSWQYNLLVSAEKPAFYLNPILDKNSNANYIQLSICTFYKAGEVSNMAVAEVELPSGYVADVEALPGLKRTSAIKRIDTSNGDTKVLIYLDKVGREEICFTVPAYRTTMVSNSKPVPVTIYDYYDRHQTARIFYEAPPATSCDICDFDNCEEICAGKPKRSERLKSLHEQRNIMAKSNPVPSQDSKAKLLESPSKTNYTEAYKILPLTRVVDTLVNVARNLY